MTMNVEIRIDAPQALPAIAAVEAGLAKVEAKGSVVGAALSEGLGKGAAAADKVKKSTDSLTDQMAKLAGAGKAFGGLEQVFKREADMLEKIKGPAKEYETDLRALDMLLQKNSISTDEYATQIARMNQAIEGTKQKTQEAAGPADKLGGMLEALAVPAIGAGIMALGQKIGDLVADMHRMEDEYTNLTNSALKFVDSTHDQNRIIDEQNQLAHDLHAGLSTTIDLYDQVRDGSDKLRISHDEQIRVTKTLGEAMQIANKPIESASAMMARFAYALESGTMSGGEFKRMAKDVPELGDLWAKHWGVSIEVMQKMIQLGKIGPRDLMNVLITDGKAIDDDFKKRKTTNEQLMTEYAKNVNIAQGRGMNGMQAVWYANAGDQHGRNVAEFGLVQANEHDEMDRGRSAVGGMLKTIDDVKNLTGAYRGLGDAQQASASVIMVGMANVGSSIAAVNSAVTELGSKFGLLADAWDHGLSSFGMTTKIVMDNAAKVGEAKQQLAALQKAVASGGISADGAAGQYRTLMTAINDGRLPAMIKVFDSLHEPMRTFHEDLAATNALWAAGRLSALDYEYQVLQLDKSNPSLQRFDAVLADHVQHLKQAAIEAKKYRDAAELGFQSPASIGMVGPQFAQTNRDALSDASIFKGADATDASSATASEKAYQQIIDQGASSASKYRDELSKIEAVKVDLSDDQYAAAIERIKEQFGASVSPAQRFSKEIAETNGLFGAGVLAFDDYKKRLKDIGKEQEKLADSGKDFSSGMSRGFHEIRDEVGDVATTVASTMKDAFNGVNADIVTMVTTGHADFSKFASTIEADFAKLALHKVEGSLFDLVGGTASDAAGGVATGTSAATTMLAAAPGIGALIGATAASAIAAASAAAGASSAVVGAIAGSWSGSSTMIHAANGYSARVGGAAGVDTKLFAAMVSPGERVTIQTPQQQAANQNGGGGAPTVQIVNRHDTRGELADALSSGSMDAHIVNVMRRQKPSIQGLLRK